MKLKLILMATVALMTLCNSRAALGWTLDETIQHYGQPTRGPQDINRQRIEYFFQIQGYEIDIFYFNEKAVHVSYSQDSVFTEPLIQAFLKVNAPDALWNFSQHKDGAKFWTVTKAGKTDNEKALIYLAFLNIDEKTLTISKPQEDGRDYQGVGTVVQFDGAEYTLTEYRAVKTYSDEHKTPDDGAVFVWITFTARNISNETEEIDFDNIQLGCDGKTFDYSKKGPLFNREYIQPTLSKKGEILFEVPANAIGKPMTFVFNSRDPRYDFSDNKSQSVPLPALTGIADN